MITVTPQGQVYLCKTPLENDYKNQLTFTNKNTQLTYFNSTIQHTFDNYTYMKKDNVIKVGINIDKIIDCNYLFYRNNGFTDDENSVRIYYCFIKNMEYVNENCTAITFETDCFQTWQFDIAYKRCFVEREHVNDDTVGIHTIPENLELGEYVINAHLRDSHLRGNLKLVMASTEAPSGEGAFYGGTYNGIYSGVQYYTYSAANVTSNLQYLADHGKIDAVSALFLAPDFVLPQTGGGPISQSQAPQQYDNGVSPITSLNGYTPINKKLLTFPYCYIMASNGNGASAIYHQELFTNTNQSGEYVFRVFGALTPGCSIRMVPINYKGSEVNHDEGINLGKYPQCNWATDMFTNWVTQNGVNVATSLIGGTVATAGGVATGNVADAVGGLSSIANSLNEVHKASLIPPQTSGNINCGDVITSAKENTFHMYRMTIRQEYARIIDKYFNMFGYKVNDVKIPNITGRQNWNFVKTIDCNFDGNIPQTDLNIIKTMFNNGVTLWHNANTMYDYSQSNSII